MTIEIYTSDKKLNTGKRFLLARLFIVRMKDF